tara:strand:+ start:7196 stop:8392 length:1197 start_codon:yes stop_codon:yes gene_type:complete
MPLSAIQTLPPKVPNSLTALLQGSGQALTGALTNAVQLGRDAVNNQVQQERSLLTERRSEINLAQRRGDNEQKQFNTDRAFGENQRQFGELDRDRDLDRTIRSTESGFRNRLSAEKLVGVKAVNAEFEEGKESRKLGRQLALDKLKFENENAPVEFALKKKEQETRETVANTNLVKSQNEALKLAGNTAEAASIKELNGEFSAGLKLFNDEKELIEKDTSLTDDEKNVKYAELVSQYEDVRETQLESVASKNLSTDISNKVVANQNMFLEEIGIKGNSTDRAQAVAQQKEFSDATQTFSNTYTEGDKLAFGHPAGISGEVETILSTPNVEAYAKNFIRPDDMTDAGFERIAEIRRKMWNRFRNMGRKKANEYINSLPRTAQGGASTASDVLSKIAPRG